jgi:hypothetical protein
MKKTPTMWKLYNLMLYCFEGNCQGEVNGNWGPARPLGYYSLRNRLRCALAVFTGKADAVVWPEDEK